MATPTRACQPWSRRSKSTRSSARYCIHDDPHHHHHAPEATKVSAPPAAWCWAGPPSVASVPTHAKVAETVVGGAVEGLLHRDSALAPWRRCASPKFACSVAYPRRSLPLYFGPTRTPRPACLSSMRFKPNPYPTLVVPNPTFNNFGNPGRAHGSRTASLAFFRPDTNANVAPPHPLPTPRRAISSRCTRSIPSPRTSRLRSSPGARISMRPIVVALASASSTCSSCTRATRFVRSLRGSPSPPPPPPCQHHHPHPRHSSTA